MLELGKIPTSKCTSVTKQGSTGNSKMDGKASLVGREKDFLVDQYRIQ